jgi:hypothetical protein
MTESIIDYSPEARLYGTMATFADILAKGCKHHVPDAYLRAFNCLEGEPAEIAKVCGILQHLLAEPTVSALLNEAQLRTIRSTLGCLTEMAGHLTDLAVEAGYLR